MVTLPSAQAPRRLQDFDAASMLARFFIDDADDPQALRQRPAAIAAMSAPALVPVTVLLELEWVMRRFYALPRADAVRVTRALLGIEHVTVEDRAAVLSAIDAFAAGLDFADALHRPAARAAPAWPPLTGHWRGAPRRWRCCRQSSC